MASFLASPIGTTIPYPSTLRSSDNNSLLQILNHKGKTTGSEAHRIRPMQHNKRIIFFILSNLLS